MQKVTGKINSLLPDQENNVTTSNKWSSGTGTYQSFTPAQDNVAGFAVSMGIAFSGSKTVTLIYNDEGNTNTPLASCQVDVDTSAVEWKICQFITPVEVASSSYLVISVGGGGSIYWSYKDSNPYDGGLFSQATGSDALFVQYYETTFPEFNLFTTLLLTSVFIVLLLIRKKKIN
ncbi:MAG: hypothetical protein ACXAC7_07550 [Candidatus Hodarchaeales archaeon]